MKLINKAVLNLKQYCMRCYSMWSLVVYSNHLHWNCVKIAYACKKLLFSGAL